MNQDKNITDHEKKKPSGFKKRKIFFLSLILFLSIIYLDYVGIIWHNAPFAFFYSVKGLDVSHHQKEIDWPEVASSKKYSFVFIKATEGHDFTDDRFKYNWDGARKNGLVAGAYHFFSMRSSGREQAELFINHVPKEVDSLPPVIDLELPLTHQPDDVRNRLTELSTNLEAHYGVKPILYVTRKNYSTYLENNFLDHKIWIRDIVKPPLDFNRDWTFWQYNNRGHVKGIETYVDINVFNGNKQEFDVMFKP